MKPSQSQTAAKEIRVRIIQKGRFLICMDLATTGIVLGTKAVAGNLKLYNVRKEKGHYKVPRSSILARIKALEARRRKIDNNLSIMRQLIP